jgi:hypothetical protein
VDAHLERESGRGQRRREGLDPQAEGGLLQVAGDGEDAFHGLKKESTVHGRTERKKRVSV